MLGDEGKHLLADNLRAKSLRGARPQRRLRTLSCGYRAGTPTSQTQITRDFARVRSMSAVIETQ
jgi:hypothetical protein